jgi:formamidopyrimidine-DNA glycosylase
VPELPEVETIRTQLEPRLAGRVLARVEILDQRLTRPNDRVAVAAELEGARVVAVERRGKYLLVRMEGGLALLVHLRMTGSFGFSPVSHERAVLELDDGARLVFRDVRRFGTWLVLDESDLEPYLTAKNGPEPLGPRFTAAWLAEQLARRRAPLKAILLDQRVVAGLGNIYADEALWRAKIHGNRLTDSLSGPKLKSVLEAAREVMGEALDQGGTSFDALYVNVNGESGYFERSLNVYGQENLPCRRCGAPIRREKFMNRSSYSCPKCQPRPRAGR